MAELLDSLFASDIEKLTHIFEIINVNCVIPGTDGCTPLHVVAGMENSGNKENLISFLLDKGANPNARSFEKLTPVHIAAMWNNCSQLEKLLQNGGNPWLTDCENKNSFDMAADNYAYEAFQLLNTYLAEDKLNFKNQISFYSSPCKTMMNIKFAQSKNDDSKVFSNTMFMTANENFPLILSSINDSSYESDFSFTKCIKDNHSLKHNQVENDSSDESVWDFSKYIKKNHSSNHNHVENDAGKEGVLDISKYIKGNHSSRHKQIENDNSEKMVCNINKHIKRNNSPKHNRHNQAKSGCFEKRVKNISCIKGNHSSKHNKVENDSSDESVRDFSKYVKKSHSSNHNQVGNDTGKESILEISKYNKRNHSSKHNQNKRTENDNSEKKVFNINKKFERNNSSKENRDNRAESDWNVSNIKENHSSKYNHVESDISKKSIISISKCIEENPHSSIRNQNNHAEKDEYRSSSNTSLSRPKLNSTYKLSSKSVNGRNNNSAKFHKDNLNHACFFSSSESEASDMTSLSISDGNSIYETVIDSDDKSGIVLVEMKSNADSIYPSDASVCSVVNDWKSYQNANSNCSPTLSSCSSNSTISVIIPESLLEYSNSRIYQELLNLGYNPGPVLDNNRHLYILQLARLKTGCKVSCEIPKPKFCPEIYQFIENKLDLIRARSLEQIMAEEFDADSSKKWREGNQRCCFNYFLLDPRVTQNLPSRVANLTTKEIFLTFLDSLFYVGKGTRGRPYSHLFEAAKSMGTESWKNSKISHILDIWKAGLGVISLHCFHNSIPVEAYTREACILEAVGMVNLTNIRKGDFYGSCAKLTTSRKRLIGVSLLERALQIFLLEGERQIKPKDIQTK